MSVTEREWKDVADEAAKRCAAGASKRRVAASPSSVPVRVPAGGRRSERGFTLAEMLVVVAILGVLFGLLFLPLMKAFGYIHTGNVRVGVQNAGRMIFEQMTREIADATYVYDNADDPLQCTLVMVLPHGVGANANQTPPASVSQVPILLPPGPGLDYGVTTPLHVHWGLFLTRALDAAGNPTPYANEWEVESRDLRGTANPDFSLEVPDNFYRIFRAEYYPNNTNAAADAGAKAYVLPVVLTSDPLARPSDFREPGELIDDSLYPGKRGDNQYRNSPVTARRRHLMEQRGLVVALSPRQDVDAAWALFAPSTNRYSVKPGLRFESLAAQNEVLDPVVTGGMPYASGYRADYGHWQVVRRKTWSTPQKLDLWARFFQVFDVRVNQDYSFSGGSRVRQYYVSIGRDDSSGGSATTVPGAYYVWRLTGSEPTTGNWPATDVPTFNMTRYKQNIDRFRQGPGPADDPVAFWNDYNPYDPALLPTDPTEPYWPEMAFLIDADRGKVEFLIDPPVREPEAGEPQPPGALAPFQVPYTPEGIAPPNGSTADWIIPDVARARASAIYGNQDAGVEGGPTTWIRIPAQTMRVMVGRPVDPSAPTGAYTWRAYTRVSNRADLGQNEFWFDELTGQLSFDSDQPELCELDGLTKIRAWYQIQTNVQRRNDRADIDSTDGNSVSASYLSKEVLRVSLALRAYDSDSGRAQPFQLSATVRPRNLR